MYSYQAQIHRVCSIANDCTLCVTAFNQKVADVRARRDASAYQLTICGANASKTVNSRVCARGWVGVLNLICR